MLLNPFLRRRLGLLAGAVLTLSLAFAGAIAVYTVFDPAVPKPLPSPDKKEVLPIARARCALQIGPVTSDAAGFDDPSTRRTEPSPTSRMTTADRA
jgi:hypothetical protein